MEDRSGPAAAAGLLPARRAGPRGQRHEAAQRGLERLADAAGDRGPQRPRHGVAGETGVEHDAGAAGRGRDARGERQAQPHRAGAGEGDDAVVGAGDRPGDLGRDAHDLELLPVGAALDGVAGRLTAPGGVQRQPVSLPAQVADEVARGVLGQRQQRPGRDRAQVAGDLAGRDVLRRARVGVAARDGGRGGAGGCAEPGDAAYGVGQQAHRDVAHQRGLPGEESGDLGGGAAGAGDLAPGAGAAHGRTLLTASPPRSGPRGNKAHPPTRWTGR